MEIIDLRSDTVTRPSKGMKKAIYNAEVGDDVYGDDPTVNHLEKKISEMLGKDEAVFMTSGTQSNFSSVLAHCNRGDEIIVGESYHICGDEAGGVSVLGGVAMNTISVETDGSVSNNSIENAIKPDDPHHAISKLLCLENTSRGKAIGLERIKESYELAKRSNLSVHLDGARFFNAIAELKCAPEDHASLADSISICLSKGLGAPAGSLLLLPKDLAKKARRIRKLAGGSLRQSGILAAAGIYALDNNIDRLKEDHIRAENFKNDLVKFFGEISDKNIICDTNMVFFTDLSDKFKNIVPFFRKENILISNWSNNTLRIVFHLDIDEDAMRKTLETFQKFYEPSKRSSD